MEDEPIQDQVAAFRVAHQAEQIELLKLPLAREELGKILIEIQTSPNHRRMGAQELANTVTAVLLMNKPVEVILRMPVLQMMSIERWNRLREKAEASPKNMARAWLATRETAAHIRGQVVIRMLPRLRGHIIRKFRNKGIDIEQLVNEGIIGVARALEKYDPEKGRRFVDYAINWVNARVFESFEKAGQVPITSSLAAARSKIKRAREDLTVRLDRDPTDDELIEDMGITESEYKRAYFSMISLDSPLVSGEDDSMTFGETIEGESGFVCQYDESLASGHIAKVLETLSEYERDVTLFRLPATGVEFKIIAPVLVDEAMDAMREVALALVEKALKREEAISSKSPKR